MSIVPTTVRIDDELLAAAKDEARRRGVTLGRLLEDATRLLLASPEGSVGPEIPVDDGGGALAPRVDPTSNRSMREAAVTSGTGRPARAIRLSDTVPRGCGSPVR